MVRLKDFRPRDLVIGEVKPGKDGTLLFTVILQTPAAVFLQEENGETPEDLLISGVLALSEETVLLTGKSDPAREFAIPLSTDEVHLFRLAVTVHLWKRYHLLPEDFYRYCTEEGFMKTCHYEDRSAYDTSWRNTIEKLGYTYPYQSNGPKKHAGYRNGAVRDLIDTEENWLTSPDRPEPAASSDPGKERCRSLREIRRLFAGINGIPYVPVPCRHPGPCQGYCPVCEAEIRYLDQALQKKKEQGEIIFESGLSLFFT